jgi:hypothetical protein
MRFLLRSFSLGASLTTSWMLLAACASVASVPVPASYITAKQPEDSNVAAVHRSPAKTVGLFLAGGAAVSGLMAYIVTRPAPAPECRCSPGGCLNCQ